MQQELTVGQDQIQTNHPLRIPLKKMRGSDSGRAISTNQRKLQLNALRAECLRQNKATEKVVKQLNEVVESEQTRLENFDYVQENLKELENVGKTLLPKMFEVIIQTKEEER